MKKGSESASAVTLEDISEKSLLELECVLLNWILKKVSPEFYIALVCYSSSSLTDK